MSLEDILDDLKAEAPAQHERIKQAPGVGPWGLMDNHTDWSAEDKQPSITLSISKYEAYWLWWRLSVHLKSYEAMEWSEMKEVLQSLILKVQQSSSTGTTLCTAEESTKLAEEVLSEPVGIPINRSQVCVVEVVMPTLAMEKMESSTDLLETS